MHNKNHVFQLVLIFDPYCKCIRILYLTRDNEIMQNPIKALIEINSQSLSVIMVFWPLQETESTESQWYVIPKSMYDIYMLNLHVMYWRDGSVLWIVAVGDGGVLWLASNDVFGHKVRVVDS